MWRYFSAFSNVGIGEAFAEENGFKCVLANEYDVNRACWFQQAHPSAKMVCGDFTDPKVFYKLVKLFKSKKCHAAFFSPCCQPFCRAGGQHLDSPAAFYFLYVLEFIKQTMPLVGMIENAHEFPKAILGDDPRPIQERIFTFLEKLGYSVKMEIQDAVDYGSPQSRKRAVFTFSRIGEVAFPKKVSVHKTVKETIGHLPPLLAGEHSSIPFHYAPPMPKVQADCMIGVLPGERSEYPVDRYGNPKLNAPGYTFRRIPDVKHSPTILQNSDQITGYSTIHYRDNRCLTIKEIILLSGLNDNWYIPPCFRSCTRFIRAVLGEAYLPHHFLANLQEIKKVLQKWEKKKVKNNLPSHSKTG